MQKAIIINGSYRKEGVSDQISNVVFKRLLDEHIEVTIINLREKNIRFCTNCRTCTQVKSDIPARCIIDDDFNTIIQKIENASMYVFIVPTNFGSATALFKCFMERLTVYGYYPWGHAAPEYRKKNLSKKALCFSSCAAPSFLGKFFFNTAKQLKTISNLLGAKVLKTTFIGMCAKEKSYNLTKKEIDKISKNTIMLAR